MREATTVKKSVEPERRKERVTTAAEKSQRLRSNLERLRKRLKNFFTIFTEKRSFLAIVPGAAREHPEHRTKKASVLRIF